MTQVYIRKRVFLAILLAVTVCLVSSFLAAPARAQQVLRIAAVVNDRVISVLDVVNRMNFVVWSTGVPNTPENRRRLSAQILRNLIDEELQAQEASRLNVSVSDRQVDGALADVAKRNKMTAEKLVNILRGNGIAEGTLRRQLRTQIAWSQAISRRLRRDIRVSDDEVDGEIDRINELRNQPQYRVSEIFLSVDDPDQDEQARLAANRLAQQIMDGADFAALASAFSQSTSASLGGDLGWIQAGRLSRELDEELLKLEPKQIAGPIRTLSGYYILMLRDRRQPQSVNLEDTVIDLHQVVLPDLSSVDETARNEYIEGVRAAMVSCAGLPDVITQIGTKESGPVGKIKIRDLPASLRDAVSELKVDEPSAPVVAASGRTIVLMVCQRNEPQKKKLNRGAVRRKLQQSRVELVARRYLRDLRRSAFIDLRG